MIILQYQTESANFHATGVFATFVPQLIENVDHL